VIAVAIMTASAARAQAPPDTVYALTTFDVSPSATLQTIASQYRDTARKQAGNISVDLLQETGLLNRFAIHESWSNRSAYDANEKAPQMAALRDGLKPLAGAPLDRRTYRPLSIGPTRNAGSDGAVYMVLFLDVFPPGLIPTLAAVKDAAAAARKGEGNLRYDVEQEGVGLGNHMIFYAAWQNRDDFDSYEKSDYARHLRDVVGPLLGSPYDDRLYALLD
jgi:quinol monooxygenase YgiN